MILIISGPTGVGKGTVINAILEKYPDFVIPDSYTTRPHRLKEGTKKQYHFVTEDEFHALAKQKKILEGVIEHMWWYGTDRETFESAYKKNRNILMELEPRGALNIKKLYPESILIFLLPDSIEDLGNRITTDSRRTNMSKKELKVRIESARREMEYALKYNYQINNPHGHPEQAVEAVEKIIEKNLHL